MSQKKPQLMGFIKWAFFGGCFFFFVGFLMPTLLLYLLKLLLNFLYT